MFSVIKFIFFLSATFIFGFTSLSQIIKINSLLVLIPFSITFGIAAYLFTCHVLSFLIGPQAASVITLIVLILISILILITKRKKLCRVEKDADNFQLLTIYLIALIISILTFIATSKYGTFDRESHMPMALTMFHNNVYPPRDCFRPDYVLLYHYGGDLLAGAVYWITNFDISRAYEIISTVLSGTTFLSFFALAWMLTKNYRLSLISGFCTYFGGGLLWLDAILRYLTKNFPEGAANWSFLQTFLNVGIHGGINNAPSVLTFISTFDLGNPLLAFCLALFWKMTQEKNIKSSIGYIAFLSIALFPLFLTADWLYVTFWAGVMPFLLILWTNKKREFLIPATITLFISMFLNKSIGNALFLQDPTQNLGRTNIFDIGIKQNLFSVVSWGRLSHYVMNYQTISCFSWDFISELGLTLFLFPIAIIHLMKTKNTFAYLLFFSALFTMPVPTIIDFKLNPVELVRLFSFGNSMLILLITCGVAFLYKDFLQKKILILIYTIAFTLSPVSQLLVGAILSPNAFSNKFMVDKIFEDVKNLKSFGDYINYYKLFNDAILNNKNRIFNLYKNEIDFFKLNGRPKDVAISQVFEVPAYAGVYSLIPSRRLIYWEQLYSPFNSVYETAFNTLDPYLLNELKIKWILVRNDLKIKLPLESQNNLSNKELFNLVYTSQKETLQQWYEIYRYQADNAKNFLSKYDRKTAWILINRQGQPVKNPDLSENKITLFATSTDALLTLKSLQDNNPNFKKELITAQPIPIAFLEKQITDSMINVLLEKRF